jgi:2'-5' RNA ligase
MPCGAALYFDAETDGAIRGLWQLIEDAGLHSGMLKQNFPPHLTILTCEDSDVDGMRESLQAYIRIHPPVPVHFHSLGVFNTEDGVIYMAPVIDRPLLDFHAELWDLLDPYIEGANPLYRPGAWVPHVTMDIDVPREQVGAVIDRLLRSGLPRQGMLNALFIADFGLDSPRFQELFKERLGAGS